MSVKVKYQFEMIKIHLHFLSVSGIKNFKNLIEERKNKANICLMQN